MILQIKPHIDKNDIKTVSRYMATTWVSEGPACRDFEKAFKKFTGAKYCANMCNGTLALFAALKALNIGPGDEVIVPSYTFAATINAVILAQATPVVVDVDYETGGINPEEINKNITNKTRAVIPVHLYGLAAEIEEIMKLAKTHGLFVVEDAAEAVGVRINGKHAGTFGDFGIFSFYGNKTITTGEGGMITSNKKSLNQKVFQLKNHGRTKKGTFVHQDIGYNFSLSDLQAALGVSQMQKINKLISAKINIYKQYRANLASSKSVKFSRIGKKVEPAHWLTNILVDNAEYLNKKLAKEKIQTRLAFFPIKRQPCYNKFKNIKFSKNLKNDDRLFKSLLSLPSYVGLSEKQIQMISQKIKQNI